MLMPFFNQNFGARKAVQTGHSRAAVTGHNIPKDVFPEHTIPEKPVDDSIVGEGRMKDGISNDPGNPESEHSCRIHSVLQAAALRLPLHRKNEACTHKPFAASHAAPHLL